ALLKDGSKGDKIDARKLAELLRGGYVKPVYHGENGLRTLKELSRSYLTISKDLTRVMNLIKALYRGWAIPCGGTQVYALCHRSLWLSKILEAGVRRRAEHFYEQLDALRGLRKQLARALLAGCSHHGQHLRWTVPRILRGFAGQGGEADDGSSHLGQEDCRDHVDRLEERSKFRRQTFETTSSLSVSGERVRPSPEDLILGGWP